MLPAPSRSSSESQAPPPTRPFFYLALACAAGSGAGWTDNTLVRIASLAGLVAVALYAPIVARAGLRPGWLLVIGLCCTLRCELLRGANALPTGSSGRWVSSDRSAPAAGGQQHGHLGWPTDRWECLAYSVSDGEGLLRLSSGTELRSAALPGEEARVHNVLFQVDELARNAPAAAAVQVPGARSLARLRQSIGRRLRAAEDALSPSSPQRGLLPALIVGDREGLSPATKDLFTRTGTRHLLALSGLHVGLMAWWIVWPLGGWLATLWSRWVGTRVAGFRRLPRAQLAPDALRALLVLTLVPLGGGGAPIWRAAVALALAALAKILPAPGSQAGKQPRGRPADGLSLWGMALCLELFIAPGSIAELGLQLSYLATLGLILGLPALGTTCPLRLREADGLGRARSPWLRAPLQRLLDWTWLAGATSVLAVVVTLPVIWCQFGYIALVGVIATPLVMLPLMGLLAAGWAQVCLPGWLPPNLLHLPGRLLIDLLELCDQLPGTPWPLPPRPWPWIVALTVLSFLLLTRRPGPRPRTWILTLGLYALLMRPAGADSQGAPELVLLDVGHGTAALLRVPGEGVWLFDAGSKDRVGVATAVGEQLRRWQTRELAVVVSHRDRDHSSAMPWILERWPARLAAGALEATAGWTGSAIDLERGRVQLPTRGLLELYLLRGTAAEGNEGSRCLEVRLGSWSALLTGDAEQDGLAGLLQGDLLRGPYDLLLLPHHGSQTPHLQALLERCTPRRIWVSCGAPAALGPELTRRGLNWTSTRLEGGLRTHLEEHLSLD